MKEAKKVYLAADLGASGGRVLAGLFDGQRLELEEIHRFDNAVVEVAGSLHWDILALFVEIRKGLALAAQRFGRNVRSLGVDTWGVDYGWLDARGKLLGIPYAYRDARTEGVMEKAFERVPRRDLYGATGIQFLPFNTIFQVLSEHLGDDPILKAADRLLFIPDLLNYWLTGRKVNERTIASTSQLLDPRTGNWHDELIGRLGLPRDVLGELVEPGTVLGPLTAGVRRETGLPADTVTVAPGCHDTASAVAAVPAGGTDYAYLSSGTWSLMGIESPESIVDDRSYAFELTNEGGVCGSIRLLKNIAGLWLVQECRRGWAARGETYSYAELTDLAAAAKPFGPVFDPDDPAFIAPGDMPAKVAEACARAGGPPPEDKGALIRAILESLALKYRRVFGMLETMAGRRLEVLHIVGGGVQNRLLNRLAAGACGRPVIAGPIEATSAGNVLMQMLALGDIASLAEGRALISRSFPTETFEPADGDRWQACDEAS